MQRSGEGIFVLLLVLGFLALAMWYVLQPKTAATEYPAYSTYSPLRDGMRALYELLPHAGVQPRRHLATEYDYPADACVVAVLGQEDELESVFAPKLDMRELRSWIEGGGCLVLLAASESMVSMTLEEELLDTTILAGPAPVVPPERNLTMTGTSSSGSSTAMSRVYQFGTQLDLAWNREPLYRDVERIEVAAPGYLPRTDAALLLAYGPDNPVLLYKQIGEGEFYWLTCPEIATNNWIERADNHRLLLAVLEQAAAERTLYFDEYIHGYTGAGSSLVQLVFKTRGGQLLLALCGALVLSYLGLMVSPARTEAQPAPPRRQSSEMVLAQADLYRRAAKRETIAAHLVEGLRRGLMEARHEHNPPANAELLRWLREAGLDQTLADPALMAYLASGKQPAGEREFLRLAKSCDALATRLRKLGASPLRGSA